MFGSSLVAVLTSAAESVDVELKNESVCIVDSVIESKAVREDD